MAGVTTAVLGLGLSAYQTIQAEKDKKNARNDLNNYERQTLDNAYENVSISTLGSDLLKEETQRRSAGMVDALQMAGGRSIVGGIPKIMSTMNAADMQAAKMLDDQYQNREYAIAGDNTRIEGIIENRDNMNIAGYSSQYDAARKQSMNGMYGIASSLAMGAAEIDKYNKNKTRDPEEALSLESRGVKTLRPLSSPYMEPYATPVERKYADDTPYLPFLQPFFL